jgi:hypothetical protein
MSEAAAIATLSPAPARPHAAERRLREIDLYAEGNSFAETDGSGQALTDLFGKDGFSFRDALDIINPLHHVPVVGTLYRALTGDELAPGSRILGGTLFGGIGGFVTALANAIVEDQTGSDIGDKVLAFFQGDAPPHQNLAASSAISAAAEPAAVAVVASQAPSPPSAPRTVPIFAGPPRALAKTPLDAGASAKTAAGQDDPTEALIRARAAVPSSRRSGIAGLPPERATAPKQPVAGGGATLAAAAPQETPAATPAVAGPATPTAPPADVTVLMRDALDKYQALMKRRASPSISGDY